MKNITSQTVKSSALTIGIIVLAVVNSFSQTTAARPDRGLTPNGSFAVSDIEHINLQNGNVGLTIPLASLPPIAGGKLSWTINAYYNSKTWDIVRSQAIGTAFDNSQHYYEIDSPQLTGGWRISGQYILDIRNAHDDFDYQPPPVADPDYSLLVNNQWYKVVLVCPMVRSMNYDHATTHPLPVVKIFFMAITKSRRQLTERCGITRSMVVISTRRS